MQEAVEIAAIHPLRAPAAVSTAHRSSLRFALSPCRSFSDVGDDGEAPFERSVIDNRATAAAPAASRIAVTLRAAGEGGGRDIERLAAGTQGDERVPPQLESLEGVPAVDVERPDSPPQFP